ncbi:CLUMA_CG017690, isoform A [Clunio marinus]|uniref:CLUMA_CG017690, isoform A n=1 Tax=Clunio marinus TaxID=568069 RepID=A0A1J1IZM3_9DIPT|nr:CLUMA_CG017690, isoform A [Clunio marinus]
MVILMLGPRKIDVQTSSDFVCGACWEDKRRKKNLKINDDHCNENAALNFNQLSIRQIDGI